MPSARHAAVQNSTDTSRALQHDRVRQHAGHVRDVRTVKTVEFGSGVRRILHACASEVHMAPARGDSKPCTHAECAGTMQFGREPLRQVGPAMSGDGARGWVCSENPGHFRVAAERERPGARA